MTKPTEEQIRNSYAHHAPKDELTVRKHEAVRSILGDAAVAMAAFLPDCRATSICLTKLEEARLWANTAVALEE